MVVSSGGSFDGSMMPVGSAGQQRGGRMRGGGGRGGAVRAGGAAARRPSSAATCSGGALRCGRLSSHAPLGGRRPGQRPGPRTSGRPYHPLLPPPRFQEDRTAGMALSTLTATAIWTTPFPLLACLCCKSSLGGDVLTSLFRGQQATFGWQTGKKPAV